MGNLCCTLPKECYEEIEIISNEEIIEKIEQKFEYEEESESEEEIVFTII